MFVCKECKKETHDYRYEKYNLCDDCQDDLVDFFPIGGEKCPVCGDEIKYLYNEDYQAVYKCMGCKFEWCYD